MRKKGFTLVELLIGSMIGAIVLMSVYVAFNAATKYWNKSNSATSAQQTARFASDHLSRNLKIAGSADKYYYNIEPGGQHLDYLVFMAGTAWKGYIYTRTNCVTSGYAVNRIYFASFDSQTGDPTAGSIQPLTGDNVAGQNNVSILPSTGNDTIFLNSSGTNGTTGTKEIVYLDFIAQDSSALSNSQTAKGAQQIEIRTAMTYPHL
ncbi:MAG: prepilin-type N-terminal cleavage/methylation domain-containing protein [Negativicutes bacterium]